MTESSYAFTKNRANACRRHKRARVNKVGGLGGRDVGMVREAWSERISKRISQHGQANDKRSQGWFIELFSL